MVSAGMAASLARLEALGAAFGEKSGIGGDGGLALTHLAAMLTNCRKVLEKALAEWRKEKAAQEEIRQAQEALEAEEIANLMEGLSHAEIVSRLSRPVEAES